MSTAVFDEAVAEKVLAGERITREDARELYRLPLNELGELANIRRNLAKRDAYDGRGKGVVTYIVDRNINYTNVCNVYCKFCAFYRTEKDADHYVLTLDQLDRKLDELTAIGGVQILLQGGHHPKLGIGHYLTMLAHIREKYPHINIHGFSPPEFQHFADVFKMPLREVIVKFKDAGLGSIPGGGGEILVQRVRDEVAKKKAGADRWLEIMEIAHQEGMKTSVTMMYGIGETLAERLEHLERVREVQARTGGFTAFICWPLQPENTPRMSHMVKTDAVDYLRTVAISRIALQNVPNIQSSWVTMGMKVGQTALRFGCNDFGSLMIEENVVSAANTTHRTSIAEMERLIHDAGFKSARRRQDYSLVSPDAVAAA